MAGDYDDISVTGGSPTVAPPAPQASANPYADISVTGLTSKGLLNATLTQAVTQSPPEIAKQRQAAATLGVPPAVVRAMPDLQQQAKIKAIDNNTQDTPALRRAYTVPEFAALGHEDHGVLATIERVLKYSVGAPTGPAGTGPSALEDVFNSLKSGAAKIAEPLYMAGSLVPQALDKLLPGNSTALSDAYFKHLVTPLEDAQNAGVLPADAPFERKAVSAVGSLAAMIASAYAMAGSPYRQPWALPCRRFRRCWATPSPTAQRRWPCPPWGMPLPPAAVSTRPPAT